MEQNGLLHSSVFRGGLCLLLVAAMLAGLFLPGNGVKILEPEDPLQQESVREISALKLGEDLVSLSTIAVPSGGGGYSREPEETNPQEPEESEPDPLKGQQQEGNENGNQGQEGGQEWNPDFCAVLTWYQYGKDPKTFLCAPDQKTAGSVNTARLMNNILKYDITLTGSDIHRAEILSVALAEGNGAFREVAESDEVSVVLPQDSRQQTLRFLVTAYAEKQDANGQMTGQTVTFDFALTCTDLPDLQLELRWTQNEQNGLMACSPDQQTAATIRNANTRNREFHFEAALTGELAKNAKLTAGAWSCKETGAGGSVLDPKQGILALEASGTYELTFTAEVEGKSYSYTFCLTYQEVLDVQLSFRWFPQGEQSGRRAVCYQNDSVTVNVKHNQLTGGRISYQMELTGADAGTGDIQTVTYESSTGETGTLQASDTLPMALAEETSKTYTLTAKALVDGQNMTFEVVLRYSNDVSLQMTYTLREDGMERTGQVFCENGKERTADTIYDDQLTDGKLSYQLSVSGEDGESVAITSVKLYRSGGGGEISADAVGTVTLLLENGKTGENSFKVTAEDGDGKTYSFIINLPYKHRGENNITIETNLQDGDPVINGTGNNLTVTAWSRDAQGNVTYIPANGVDTVLTVKLDGKLVTYVSTSGSSSEYTLIPDNPEVGDSNTHTLEIYAENAYGDYGNLTLTLNGKRREAGQKIGKATISIDMTVLGLDVVETISCDVLAEEPVSYVVAKWILGQDTGEPFGAASNTLGWSGESSGSLDQGYYLRSLTTGYTPNALEDGNWPGDTEEEVFAAIDARFGKGTDLATLWRCLYRNGLAKSEGSGSSIGEMDYTSGSGWLYSVGGATYYPGQSMSAVYLQDGDSLVLRYTLAYGWDVGGGTPGYGNTVGYCITAGNGGFSVSHQMETVTREDGTQIYTCRCCGLTEDCAHTDVIWKDMEDGTHCRYCENCHKTIGEPAEHSWETATEENHTCSQCGALEAHSWQDVEGTNTATCEEAGTVTQTCRICGEEQVVEAPVKGHTYDSTWYYTASGHYHKCSVCDTEADQGDHQYLYYEADDDYQCTVCHIWHDWEAECGGTPELIGATCQQKVYHCDGCGYQLVQQGTFAEYHDYVQGICQTCGTEDPDYLPEGSEEQEEPETYALRSGWPLVNRLRIIWEEFK